MADLPSPKIRLKLIMFDIDHIDPRWEEGRDYQLVCGRECPENLIKRDFSLNRSKNNRFLPWRYCPDEIGTIPVEQGDLCQFLVGADIENDIPGEWVLMEFLSEEWFEATKQYCGSYYGALKTKDTWEGQSEHMRQIAISRWEDEENHIRQGKVLQAWASDNPEKVKARNQLVSEILTDSPKCRAAGVKGSQIMFKCTITGKITNAGALAKWQRKRGIDPANRIQLE